MTVKDKILSKSILHGRGIVGEVLHIIYKGNLPEVRVSPDVKIVTVVDKYSNGNATLRKSNIIDNEVEFIVINKYIKWISKVQELYNYIVNNYESLPNYILYLDGSDTLIINDIQKPKEILDYYGCKVLFNSEPDFWHTGTQTPKDYPKYYDKLQYEIRYEYVEKNKKKYCLDNDYHQSLNAGVFLGEKEFIVKLLKECLTFMNDDYHKGYPYGDTDDQLLLRYFHNKYFEDISIDLFHKTMFWGSYDSFKEEENILSPDLLIDKRINYEKNRK
jgi:hypothetical protein